MKPKNLILFSLAILLAFVPVIHSKSAIYGTIIHRTFFLWGVIDVLILVSLWQWNKIFLKFNLLTISILAYLIVYFLSAILGEQPYLNIFSTFERMNGFVSVLHCVILFLIFSENHFSPKQNNQLLWLAFIIAVLASIFGISEAFKGKFFRAESVLSNPMHLAGYLLPFVFVGAYLFSKSSNLIQKLGASLGLILILFGLTMTQTRAVFLGIGIGLVVAIAILFFSSKNKSKLLKISGTSIFLFLIIAFVGIKFLGGNRIPIIARTLDGNFFQDTIFTRLQLWKMCLSGLSERPVLGWGMNSFTSYFFKYFDSSLNGQGIWYDSSHNVILDHLVGMGILGLLAYVAIYFFALKTLWSSENTHEKLIKILLTSFLTAYFVFLLFGFDGIVSQLLFFVSLVIVQQGSSLKSFKINKAFNLILIGAGIVFSVYSGYFLVFKSYQANRLLTAGFFEQEANQKLRSYQAAFDASTIGKYDVAMDFVLKKGDFLNQSMPLEVQKQFYDQCLGMLNQLLILHPFNPMVLSQKGYLVFEAGYKEEGIKIFKQLAAMSPNRLVNKHDLAWMMVNNNQLDESIKVLDEIITKQKNADLAILTKARILFSQQKPTEAYATLNRLSAEELIKNYDAITSLIFETGYYDGFHELLNTRFFKDIPMLIKLNKMPDEQLFKWIQIAHAGQKKEHVFSAVTNYAGQKLIVYWPKTNHWAYAKKQDSINVLNLIGQLQANNIKPEDAFNKINEMKLALGR
jgi:O-antigen ligase/tetratricopeptide (TPR) repeat protein